jgi:Fe-S-cluster-containing dehydrogenase component
MKCDMCYDRTSVGKKPMCATVCPSQALFFGTREQIEHLRPMSEPTNRFLFGSQVITTRVFVMSPRGVTLREPWLDVTAAMADQPREREVRFRVLPAAGSASSLETGPADPYAHVRV